MNCPKCGTRINPAALMGKRGGKNSRKNMTPEKAQEIAKKAVMARIAKYGQTIRKV